MEKQAFFFIDDVIWVMRDLTRERPKSLFDNAFMKMLKKGHDDYGMTVQLNLFYRTDFFYGNDEFTLAEMTDAYKAEFEENSNWLRLAFHAKQEFPDYPYVNATYDDVKANYETIVGEIKRFAGEKSVSPAICPHWLPISKAGCRALADCGVKFVTPSVGETKEYTGDESVLPYGHAMRLLHNRQPETKLFARRTRDTRIASSICAYNHISDEQKAEIYGKNTSIYDEEVGLSFKIFGGGPTLNLNTVETMTETLAKLNGNQFIGTATHEQYFYPDYFNYQPDYAEKYYALGKILKEYGYRFITVDEMK
ncbi:MAG: hypothetical protein E7613_02515 [Ruminococcaceae bacterium]|nr:hypothetical protein [Oscillospiraceae bacterium]